MQLFGIFKWLVPISPYNVKQCHLLEARRLVVNVKSILFNKRPHQVVVPHYHRYLTRVEIRLKAINMVVPVVRVLRTVCFVVDHVSDPVRGVLCRKNTQ